MVIKQVHALKRAYAMYLPHSMKCWQLRFVTSEPMQDYVRATCPIDESLLETQASMNKKEASLESSLVSPHDLIGEPSLKVLTFFLGRLGSHLCHP